MSKIAVPMEMERPVTPRLVAIDLADLPRLPITWFSTTPAEEDDDDPQGQAD